MPVPTDASKETIKKYEKLWNQIKDPIRSITNNLSITSQLWWKTYQNQM